MKHNPEQSLKYLFSGLAFLILLLTGLRLSVAAPKNELLREDVSYVNAMTYGTTHTSATIAAAIASAEIGSTRRTLYLETGTWTIDAVVIPANVTLWIPAGTTVTVTGTMTVAGILHIDGGGTLCPGDGAVISLTNAVDAPETPVFCTSGTVLLPGKTTVPVVWFGAVNDGNFGGGGTDTVPAWDAAVRALEISGGGVIQFPAGVYAFASKPRALSGGITVRGVSMRTTSLVRGYTEADVKLGFIDMAVGNTITGTYNAGGGVLNLMLWAATGTTGGSAINIESSATVATGDIKMEWLQITGDGTWNYNIRADGSEKRDDPVGVRVVVVSHCFLFQATQVGLIFLAVEHAMINDVGIYSGTGVADFVVNGGTGLPAVPSTYIRAEMGFCPTVVLGTGGGSTSEIYFSTEYTVTLTVGTLLGHYTLSGHINAIVGTSAAADSPGTGFWTPGRIYAGVSTPDAAGAHLQTSDGVRFPATPVPSSDPATLDAYLEGTFTPRVVGSSGLGVATYTKQSGYYTKIGRTVMYDIRLEWSSHTGTGNLVVDTLPFASTSEADYFAAVTIYASSEVAVGTGKQLVGLLFPAGAGIQFRGYDPTGVLGVTVVPISNSGVLVLSGAYRAAE